MEDKLIKEIEELLNSEISSFKIAKDSGVTYSLLSDYRNSKRKIENMTLQVSKKLIRYNERLSPKIRGFFVGEFLGKVSKSLLKFIIFLNTSVIFQNEINILWYIDKYIVYTFVIIRYISNLEDVWYNMTIIKRK